MKRNLNEFLQELKSEFDSRIAGIPVSLIVQVRQKLLEFCSKARGDLFPVQAENIDNLTRFGKQEIYRLHEIGGSWKFTSVKIVNEDEYCLPPGIGVNNFPEVTVKSLNDTRSS